jgi:hypothetical protein
MSIFGPFIPLFVPWNGLWRYPANHAPCYHHTLMDIRFFLWPECIYVTVSQNSQGIAGINYCPIPIPENVLILSSGGKGHIPVLRWLREFKPVQFSVADEYTYDIVFMGSMRTHWTRKLLIHMMLNRLHERTYASVGTNWTTMCHQSKFILCPRGFGRNSYRLGEVLQMGMVPIFVYNDLIWLPYYDSLNWSQSAIITRYNRFQQQLDLIIDTSAQNSGRMRLRIRKLFPTHFSPQGVWRQITAFLNTGFQTSDLRCAIYTHRFLTMFANIGSQVSVSYQ